MSAYVRLIVKAAAATVLIPTALICGCNTAEDEPPPAGPGNGGSITVDGITLTWKPDGQNLNVTVKAPTTGWVAVGFDPTVGMKDANLIIGYVKGGQTFVRDDYGAAPTAHQADASGGGRDNVTNKRGKEEGGATEISFTIPLDSGDGRDRKLVVGQTYKVLLAHGPNGADDFTTQHRKRTAANIKI